MKTKPAISLIFLAVAPASAETAAGNTPVNYLIGGIIALLIMVYLVYTLIRPEKF